MSSAERVDPAVVIARVTAIAETMLHDCEWNNRLGRYMYTPWCRRCQLDQAVGGVNSNGEAAS